MDTIVPEVKLTQEEAEAILKSVIDSLPDVGKQNLRTNLQAGRRLNCGNRAYIFSDDNAGCLLTLATTTNLPDGRLDLKTIKVVDEMVWPIYRFVIEEHTLKYHMACVMMEEESFKSFILKCLDKAE